MRTCSTAAELAHDLAVDPWNGREAAGPIVAIVRPGDPGGLVRLPFGGHAEARAPRRGLGSIDHPVQDGSVGIDAAVAQEGPVAARLFDAARVAFDNQRLFVGRALASASSTPNGSATKEAPQNSRPCSGGPSKPTRLTAATKTPLAMAWAR